MGCWIETCAVTKAPIRAGVGVNMVVFASNYPTHMLLKWYNLISSAVFITHGSYNEYGWVDGADAYLEQDPSAHMRAIFVIDWVWGMIIEQANVEVGAATVLNSIRHDRKILLLNDDFRNVDAKDRSFIDNVMGSMYGSVSIDLVRNDLWWTKFEDWIKVLWFCHSVHVDPTSGLAFKGHQDRDLKTYSLWASLINLTNRYANKQRP